MDENTFVEILQTMKSGGQNMRAAENQYHQLKKDNANFVANTLLKILQEPASGPELKAYAAILLRQAFLQDKMHKEIMILKCSQTTQGAVASSLLDCYQKEADVQVRKQLGPAILALAEQMLGNEKTMEYDEEKWPECLSTILGCARAADKNMQENALDLLSDMVPIYKKTLLKEADGMQKLLGELFADAVPAIRTKGIYIVTAMVCCYDGKEWKPLVQTLNVILRILENLAQLKENKLLSESLENLEAVVEIRPMFFKQHVAELAALLPQIIAARNELSHEPRSSALQFFIALAEKRPKMCREQCGDFPSYLLKAAMDCMLEIEDDAAWAQVMDDEEDDDEDELYKFGGEVVDRVVCAFKIKTIGPAYFQAIGSYVSNENFKYKIAALSAISEGVEYVEKKEHLDELMQLCIVHTSHDHMRVRAQAWHALSRIISDHVDVADRWHAQYMEATFAGLDDKVERVQAKNLSAFLYFGEQLDPVTMEGYCKQFMDKLIFKIGNSNHRGVIEESITAIAVVAGSIGTEFAPYYDSLMPMLKNFITRSTDEKETRLRGKAFECMSLFGVAVRKDKFKEDVVVCMEAMLGSGTTTAGMADQKNAECLRDYLKDAIERVAQVMCEDFARFLPQVLPGYLQSLDYDNLMTGKGAGGADKDEETITLGNGQKIRDQFVREMADAAETLSVLVSSCKEGFEPHMQQVVTVLAKLFESANEDVRVALDSEDVLDKCSDVWAEIVKILAKKNPGMCKDFVLKYCQMNVPWLQKEDQDIDMVMNVAKGVSTVLKACCPEPKMSAEKKAEFADPAQYLDQPTIFQLTQLVFSKMKTTFEEREQMLISWKEEEEDGVDGERNELDEEDECHDCCVALSEVLGSMMQINKSLMSQHFLAGIQELLERLLNPANINREVKKSDREVIEKKNKILAYFLACDVIEYLGKDGLAAWPKFLQPLLQDLVHPDYEVRHSASYCVYLAASMPEFQQHSQVVIQNLLQVIKGDSEIFGKTAQNRYVSNEEIMIAQDNTVAALFQLLAYNQQLSQSQPDLWTEVFSNLPLKNDTEMGLYVNKEIVQLLRNERSDVFQGDKGTGMAKCVGLLADVYRTDGCDDELEEELQKLMKSIPETVFLQVKPSLKDTQWRKIEKIVRDANDKGN